MFDLRSLRNNPRARVPLCISSEELTALMGSIGHKKFESGWKYRFHILPGNETDRASVAWLACYCENGGSSERYAQQARVIFNKIFPFSYEEFRDAGFVELARSWRKWVDRDRWKTSDQEPPVEPVPDDSPVDLLSGIHSRQPLGIKFRALLLGLFTFWHALQASSQNSRSRT
jgi:hypothetical protein